MSGYAAIEETGKTLVTLLESELAEFSIVGDDVVVELVSPGDVEGYDLNLSLYLFRVDENAHLKNREPEVRSGVATPPPLTLDLHYLLTAHPGKRNPESEDSYQQHRILGRAMQVLSDNPTLQAAQPSGDDLHLSLVSQSMEELTAVWSTFGERPYQPSVAYLVTPVAVESDRSTAVRPVAERRVDPVVPARRGNEEARSS